MTMVHKNFHTQPRGCCVYSPDERNSLRIRLRKLRSLLLCPMSERALTEVFPGVP